MFFGKPALRHKSIKEYCKTYYSRTLLIVTCRFSTGFLYFSTDLQTTIRNVAHA